MIILDGTAVNQDGRSSSLTAPNGPAQQAAMRLAVADASQHLGGNRLDSMQCHGTGTSLGDPIEIGAVNAVHGGKRRAAGGGGAGGAGGGAGGASSRAGAGAGHEGSSLFSSSSSSLSSSSSQPPLVLQAVKSYMGHCETAAGIMGLIQPLVGLAQASSAKVLHLTALNPHIGNVMKAANARGGGEGGNPAAAAALSMHNPRQTSGAAASSRGGSGGQESSSSCGVGAFAFQGTNAHAIVVITREQPGAGGVHRGGVGGGGGGGGCGLMFERKRHWPTPTESAPERPVAGVVSYLEGRVGGSEGRGATVRAAALGRA